MDGPDEDEIEAEGSAAGGEILTLVLEPAEAGVRLDKALSDKAQGVSRARLQALIEAGAVRFGGAPLRSGSAKAQAGVYEILVPAPVPADPEPEAIPLVVLYEDADLIVVDKPAGLAVHPAPGCERGTLVNALLHHCAGSLSGVGGVARPGIVHRLDKNTSGVMVAAKTDAAHAGLSAQFAVRDLERAYVALTASAPQPARGVIESRIGRSPHDRKKMAVLKSGGREAVTLYVVERAFGPPARPSAARVICRLKTGRTHQIRVHLASRGTPCLGDPVYGSGKAVREVEAAVAEAGLARQALHATLLGFVHPVTGERLRFETPPPEDMRALEQALGEL